MERTRSPLSLLVALLLLRLTWMGLAAAVNADNKEGRVGSPGDACSMKDGSAGMCLPIAQCNASREALGRGDAPSTCSDDPLTSVVCCSVATTGNSTATPPSRRRRDATSMAAEMCTKYAEAVYVSVELPTLLVTPEFSKIDTCALKGIPFIVGGEQAKPNEFPHMALLGFGNKEQPKWNCGGSLISERYVLTVAHCLQTPKSSGPPVVVRLGELNLKLDHEPNNQHVDYDVAEILPHPNYKTNSFYNDIGLVELERDVDFTRSIRPACLNTLTEIPEKRAVATGWGIVNWGDTKTSDSLLKVKLPLQPADICRGAFPTPNRRLEQGFLDESMICAGELSGGKDTCQGDTGGPLQIRLENPYCMYSIIGITSFGKGCAQKDSPAVYTRVSHFVPWIESIVWP